MSSHNQNPDLRYTHFQKPQQNSPTNRKPPPIAQIQHHQKQSGIMSYFSPSSGNTNNNRSTASNPSTTIINQSQQIYFHSSLPPNQFINPTAIPGGSARVQQNHVNSNSSIISNGIRQIPSQKSRPSEKSGIEDSEERSATPDSTTEPPPRVVKPSFKKGDDVFFRTDDGQHILGTVGLIYAQTLQILFGDGTQQWASFKRVKKLSCSVKDEEEPDTKPNNNNNSKNNKLGSSSSSSGSVDQSITNINNSEEITCGSCGTVKVMKRVAGRKALNFAPHTAQQFNCRRCLNKSSCNNNNLPMSTILISQPVGRGKTIQLPASSAGVHKSSAEMQRETIESSRRSEICFHCEGNTTYNDRLHCNLCERACHLSCLSMSPIPLEGDRFWDVICSACGTQNGASGSSGRTKVFSCRRSITSWSDVAHLVLSCLGTQNPGERFFDLEQQVIPFIADCLDKLHLPRAYKNTADKKMFLKTALSNAKLRFINGKDVHKKDSFWGIRDNNNHQGYPIRLPSSNNSSSTSAPSKTSKGPPSTKALTLQGSAKGASNSRYGVPSDTPLRVHPTSAFANGGNSTSSDVHSKVVASIPLLKSSSIKGSPPGATSPIRSFNVSSTQQESVHNSEGSSRTLGKSGTKGLSPKKQPTPITSLALKPSTLNISPLKEPSTLRANSRKRSSSSMTLEIEPQKPEVESETSDFEEGVRKSSTETESESNSSDSDKLTDKTHHSKGPVGAQRNKRKLSISADDSYANGTKTTAMSSSSSSAVAVDVTASANKRPRLSEDLQINRFPTLVKPQSDIGNKLNRPSSVLISPMISPIADKMTSIFKSFNGAAAAGDSESHLKTPVKSSLKIPSPPSSAGKAVKSASITSPGNNIPILAKPQLRIRKPKVSQEPSKDTKKDKDSSDGSGAVKKTIITSKKDKLGKGKTRGRPLKTANGIGTNNGVPAAEETTKMDCSDGSNFSVLKSTVEDFALYGLGCTVSCLPKAPKTAQEHAKLITQVTGYFQSEEKPSPPSYWKSSNNGASSSRWQKSKKDLKNLDSYDITGRMMDENGQIYYQYSWKDGYGNESPDEDNANDNDYYHIEDENVDDPTALFEKMDQLDMDTSMETTLGIDLETNDVKVNIIDLEKIHSSNKGIVVASSSTSSATSPVENREKEFFVVSGLGLRKNNSLTLRTLASSQHEEIIDLTDSP